MARVGSWEGEIVVMMRLIFMFMSCAKPEGKTKMNDYFLDSKFEMHLELHDSL